MSPPVVVPLPPGRGPLSLQRGGSTLSRTRSSAEAPSSPQRAFTLIELLITLGILAVLASLLVPALAKARHSAYTARCTAQLRQFGLAAQLYWDDHEGASFRYRREAAQGGDLYWFGWLERGSEGERAFDPTPGALWPYLPTQEIRACPALRIWDSHFKLKAIGAICGYGYNLALAAPLDRPPVRISAALCPAELVVFVDAAQVNDFQPPASPQHPLLEEFYYVNATERTAHFRHQRLAAAVLADGHVQRQRPVPGSLDARLPGAHVGLLPPRILRFP